MTGPSFDTAKSVRAWMRALRNLPGEVRHHRSMSGRGLPPFRRRLAEQLCLLAARGITAANYYQNGLFDGTLTWAQKEAFLGSFAGQRWQRQVNPPDYDGITEDKLVFTKYFTGLGIPVPPILAVITSAGHARACAILTSRDEVVRWLDTSPALELFVKPARGINGALTFGLRRDPRSAIWHSKPVSSHTSSVEWADRFLRAPDWLPLVIQPWLRPHPTLAPLAADVLHTARIVTLMSGSVTVLAAALKICSGHTAADNLLKGNLVAPIDLVNGELGVGHRIVDGLPHECPRHPVTNAPIAGLTLPDWPRALALVRTGHEHLSFNGILGWDVGFTEKGPVVIEANGWFDPLLTQVAHRRGLLDGCLANYFAEHGLFRYCGLKF